MKKIFLLCGLVYLIPTLVSAATLSVSPSSHSVAVGETFVVSVKLDTQGKAVDGVDLRYLNFNPSLLQVQDANPSVSGVQIAPGGLMTLNILASADNSAGRISFSQVAAGGTKYTGSGTLATITFKAIASGTANLTFNHSPGNTTDSNVAAGGADILNAVVNGLYTIRGGVAPVPPVVAPTTPTTPTYTPPSTVKSPVSTSRPGRTNTDGTFVPLPEVVVDDTTADGSSGSFWDFIEYIISRIKAGFVRLFGR